jgi:hypothetical protein
MTGHLGGIALDVVEGLPAESATLLDKAESRNRIVINCGLLIMIPPTKKAHNDGLQLRRAISIQAERKEVI